MFNITCSEADNSGYDHEAGQPLVYREGHVRTKIVIIDSCTYSRLALESLISHLDYRLTLSVFDCVSDYKYWNEMNSSEDNILIILNVSFASLYSEEATEFLRYEKNIPQEKGVRRIMLLSSEGGHWMYKNFIIVHAILSGGVFPRLIFVNDVKRHSLSSFQELLSQFVEGGPITFPCRIDCNKKFAHGFTTGDRRVFRMILTGKSVSYYSSIYGVSIKTLYTQRMKAFNKMTHDYFRGGVR